MDALKKAGEELAMKARIFLMKVAEEVMSDVDEPDLLSEKEISAFVRRTMDELAMDRRLGLHTRAWVSDVEEYARNLASKAINEKLKRATKASFQPRGSGFGGEF